MTRPRRKSHRESDFLTEIETFEWWRYIILFLAPAFFGWLIAQITLYMLPVEIMEDPDELDYAKHDQL